jgi:hypothetical protein
VPGCADKVNPRHIMPRMMMDFLIFG